MRRVILMILTLFVAVAYAADERSQTIVFINGQKFYVHSVAAGETIYSLSKLYEVSEEQIYSSNGELRQGGLKRGESIKIPLKSDAFGQESKTMDRKSRKGFDLHTVSQGETLYAISRKYQLSVATIVEDNPEIDPAKLSLGQQILIRKRSVGKSSEEEIITELKEYKESMNRVAPAGYEYHLVLPKETLYTLLRTTQMSRKEFFEVNDRLGINDLKAGEIVLVREKESREKASREKESHPQAQEQGVQSDESDAEHTSSKSEEVRFAALRGRDTLHVSLLLPLSTSSGSVVPIFEEFYQGFLLGIEDLKESGRNVKVSLFDTKRSLGEVSRIAREEEAFKRSDLIVGPVYEELLEEVVVFAQENSIPVVSPLATLQNSSSGVLFQMAPLAEHRYDKIGDILSDSVRVALIYTASTDSQYESEVKELLGSRAYETHIYEYEHPSAVSEREREARKLNEEPEPSPSDLSPLIHRDSTATLFIMADNETDVDRVLSALVSAQIGLRSRSLTLCDFRVVNNSKWNRYPNIDRSVMFRNHFIAFSSYHAKRSSEVIKSFDSRYVAEFSALPSLYSYRGYDVAKIFGEGLYSDIEYGMEGRTFTPLQTTYRFQKIAGKQSRANQNWMRVNYNDNFTITLE